MDTVNNTMEIHAISAMSKHLAHTILFSQKLYTSNWQFVWMICVNILKVQFSFISINKILISHDGWFKF